MATIRERFFVAFDISNDRRRRQLVKILETFGVRVQYSLFEFWLTSARKKEFLSCLRKKLFLEHNDGESLLFVPIPDSIITKIERYGGTDKTFDSKNIIIF